MKKIIIPAIALLCMCNTSKAADDNVKYNIFYGTEASNKPNNPCKGATIRICGKLVASFTAISDNETSVNEKLLDANDNIIRISDYNMNCSVEAAKFDFEMKCYKNSIELEKVPSISGKNED